MRNKRSHNNRPHSGLMAYGYPGNQMYHPMEQNRQTRFEPGCTSLTLCHIQINPSIDIPPELRHFFGPTIASPVAALNNLARVSGGVDQLRS
ncbi:hypothetical protein BCON_0132g00100 [Botryotinia convoluta]|uniref:Uncharacterized protein n=1 Tax=Botryotinia convoluta TaxID=54673 RepID=A0A4Z1I7M3_9HELO|nr:hypothetical protein BCON_0132g00100 [Botryotinia convoluta]